MNYTTPVRADVLEPQTHRGASILESEPNHGNLFASWKERVEFPVRSVTSSSHRGLVNRIRPTESEVSISEVQAFGRY